MKRIVLILAGIGLMVTAGTALAAGSASAGKSLSGRCAACHGADGNSATPQFPKLAGQHAGYITKQLADFHSGARKNATMSGMVAGLSKRNMEDLGAYFAEQKMTKIGTTNMKLAKEGEMLYRGGDTSTHVPACMSCHGPTGMGVPPNFPRVSGQYSAYLQAQLVAFKNGTRTNDNKVMQKIAFRMSLEQIKAVSAYMEGLTAR
jgi:cytochrome c553